MTEKIHIFDTTLRDGEQSPGASMNLEEKIQIAEVLDVINSSTLLASIFKVSFSESIKTGIKLFTDAGISFILPML